MRWNSSSDSAPMHMRCDMNTDGGGCTFIRNVIPCKCRFQTSLGWLWKWIWKIRLELRNIHCQLEIMFTWWLTSRSRWKWNVMDLSSVYGWWLQRKVYRLHIGKLKVHQVARMQWHTIMVLMLFTTSDNNNDLGGSINCATDVGGDWWFKNCYRSYLQDVQMKICPKACPPYEIECIKEQIWGY